MADDQDDAQKTEEPTPKKLQDAAEKGDSPRSQEVRTWFMLLTATIAFALFARSSGAFLSEELKGIFAHAHDISVNQGGILDLVRQISLAVFGALGLPVLMLLAAAFGGTLIQGKIHISAEKMKPKLSKISPMKGLKRLFSVQSLADFGKSLSKLLIIGGACVILLWPERARLVDVITLDPSAVLATVVAMALKLAIAVVAIMTVVAALDYALQYQQFRKRMKMTRQEVKDEHKQMEGDPQVKARIRQIRMQRAKQRISQAVPEADVIVTNPTHYAVALKYSHGDMAVPRLVAKGADFLAAKIREIAKENDIPIIENPPLARSIYASVDVDEDIPPEHYKAVAEVIAYVLKLKGRL